ncbi:MAG: hypothetical protein AAGK14_02810 [Verrucomicrobiota bacterium]
MNVRSAFLLAGIGLSLSALPGWGARPADVRPEVDPAAPLRHIVVLIPDFEACALVDPAPPDGSRRERVVWGEGAAPVAGYAALHPANHLEPRPTLRLAGRDMGTGLVYALTHRQPGVPAFQPLMEDVNFFVFAYDWRQAIHEKLAPQLERALRRMAATAANQLGTQPDRIRFVLVAHGAGGLIARTFISTQPRLADRVEHLYLVATPNLGSAHALRSLLGGTGRAAGLEATDGADGAVPGWGGLYGQLGEADAAVPGTRLIAASLPSLYQLIPMRNPDWIRDTTNPDEPRLRVAGRDMLALGTWADYWPGADDETVFLLENNLLAHRDRTAEAAPERWLLFQDVTLTHLQRLLAATRDWRLAMGTVGYTAQLLQRAGEAPRLTLVTPRGVRTPTGLISEGTGGEVRTRFLYGPFADGDGLVTLESMVEDIRDPSRILVLEKTTHDQAISHPRFLARLLREVAGLQRLESAADQQMAQVLPLEGPATTP